jgi:hypothetical protein
MELSMNTIRTRRLSSALFVLLLLACSAGAPTGPRTTDVDISRSRWLANRPQSYTFEVEPSSSWSAPAGYYRIRVENGQVVETRDPKGAATDFWVTIDMIWDRILTARAKNELNSAEFDLRGVPVESDTGQWPVDGGVHYSVRNFVER